MSLLVKDGSSYIDEDAIAQYNQELLAILAGEGE